MQNSTLLRLLLKRAASIGRMNPPRDWVANRDLVPILAAVDGLARTTAYQLGLPGLWHQLKLLTMQSLPKMNAPTALIALHHLSKHGACSLVETRRLQDVIAHGMLSLSYNQLLSVFASVAQAGAPLTPLLRETALRKMRALIVTVDDANLWMTGEVLLRHFPQHAGFAEALLMRCNSTIVKGSPPTLSLVSRGPRATLSVGDVLFLTFVITRCRRASLSTVKLAEVSLERFTAVESPQPRHILLAFAVASVHAPFSTVCAGVAVRCAEEILKDLRGGVIKCTVTLRSIARLCASVHSFGHDTVSKLACETVRELLDVLPGTLPDSASILVAAKVIAAYTTADPAGKRSMVSTDTDTTADDASTSLFDDARRLLRTRLQRVVASIEYTALPPLLRAVGQAGVLDKAVAVFTLDRLKNSKGISVGVAQRCLALLEEFGVMPPDAPTNTGLMAGDVDSSSSPDSKFELTSRLVVAMARQNWRLVDATVTSLVALRGPDALAPRDALHCIAQCTQHRAPSSRGALSHLAFLVNSESRRKDASSPTVRIMGTLMGLFAATRVSGLVPDEARDALLDRHLACLLRPGRTTQGSEEAHPPAPRMVDELTTSDALIVLHCLSFTHRWPQPVLLSALRPVRREEPQRSPWQVAESIRLVCLYGIDEPAVITGLADELSSCVASLPTRGIEEVLHHAILALSSNDAKRFTDAAAPEVQSRLSRAARDISGTSTPRIEEHIALLSCGVHCCDLTDTTVTANCQALLESLGHLDTKWPLRTSLSAFGGFSFLPQGHPLKAKAIPWWKETVKRIGRVSLAESPLAQVRHLADCFVIALRYGVSSSLLDTVGAKLAARSLAPHQIANIARYAARLPSRRSPISELVSKGFDQSTARAMSASSLAAVVAFFNSSPERATLGTISADAAVAIAWSSLELKIERLAPSEVVQLVTSCPVGYSAALAARVSGVLADADPNHFADCVNLLYKWRPIHEWSATAATRLACIRDRIPAERLRVVDELISALPL